MPDSSSPRRLDSTAVAGAILCCALWGGNAVAVKYAVPAIPAFGCAGLRFVLSLPIVAIVCRASGQSLWVERRHWGLLGLHALLTVIQIGTFNWGTSRSLAGRSSVFINVHPLVVAPLAWLVLGERISGRGISGLASAAMGVFLLFSTSGRGGGDPLGDAVVLGSGIVFGIQTIAQKKTFPLIPPATLLFGQSLLSIPLFFAYSAAFEGLNQYQFTRSSILGVLYQGLVVSGVCFSTWMLLLRRYPAGRLATVAFVTPLFGIGLGHLTRGEPLSWPLVAGAGLVGTGIYLVASDRTAHHPRPEPELPGEDAP